MPLGKYYCDYCDKQFQDTPSARKRHLQGLQHQRARALWYDSLSRPSPFNDLPQSVKPICNSFARTGFCRYGDGCKYFHPKQNLQPSGQAMPGKSFLNASTFIAATLVYRYVLLKPVFVSLYLHFGCAGSLIKDGMGMSLANLPPSLMLPPDGGYPPLPFIDWG
ncbi:Zinc finger CCCH domain-containing protein 3 [Nymphaea thermarum]|nr:Zinc finger CCCH domain-containing protein 3 [Nymphaea thermarum]